MSRHPSSDAAQPRGRPRIQPLVLISVEPVTAHLAGAVTLGIAAHQPHALPFFCSLTFDATRQDFGARIRRAFETVTDLAERENALLTGNLVEDRIRVVLPFLLGSPAIEERLPRVLERIHRIGGNFFDQTTFELHAVAFLPDLAVHGTQAYADAYRQLCMLEGSTPPTGPMDASNSGSLDYIWLCDCRTHSGAHAGTLEDVLEPAAQLITLLLDGEAERLHGAGANREAALRTTALGRRTAYSSFGAATLFHHSAMLARALAARAAVLHLAHYGIGGEPASHADAFRSREPSLELEEEREDRIVADRLREWAERAALRDHFENPLAEGEEPTQRRRRLERLEQAGVAAVRGWVAERGIAFAGRVLKAADATVWEGDELPVIVPGVSLASLRTELRFRLRELIELACRNEEDGLAQHRRLLEDDADPETLREALEALQARRALFEKATSPAEGDAAHAATADAVPADVEAAQPAPEPPPIVQQATQRRAGWIQRLIALLLGRREAATASPPEPTPEVVPTAAEPTTAPKRPEPTPQLLAEQKRWLDEYAALIDRLYAALTTHTTELSGAVEYYRRVAADLEVALTERTNFRLPVLAKTDLERYAAEYVPLLCDALEQRMSAGRIADCLAGARDGEDGEAERLDGFDALLAEVGHEVLAPVESETLAAVLAGRGSVPRRFGPPDLVRTLLEASEPLVRPRAIPAVGPTARRWIVAHDSLHGWLSEDQESAGLLAEHGVLELETPRSGSVLMGASLHGFPAFAVQKVHELRARAASRGAARSGPYDDVVPLELARTHPAGDRIVRVLVAARALGLIDVEDHRVAYGDRLVAGDLLDVAHAMAYDAEQRTLEAELDAAVGEALAAADGVDRLRRALRADGLSPAEQRIVLELIADLDTQDAAVEPASAPSRTTAAEDATVLARRWAEAS